MMVIKPTELNTVRKIAIKHNSYLIEEPTDLNNQVCIIIETVNRKVEAEVRMFIISHYPDLKQLL